MRGIFGGVSAAALVGASMAWLWGFTVDDALITCRVAWNLARGLGYRFNAGGPVVDAVTPLGFAYVLAPFAKAGPLQALAFSKALGAATVLLAGFFLGRRIVQRTSVAYGGALLGCLAVTAPIAAWAVSGMETGLVTALCIAALGRGWAADLAAALASAWRPELAPWCASVRLGLRLAEGMKLARALGSPALVLGAVAVVAAVRSLVFGRAAPLSVFAKPSDLEHGLRYALFGFVQTGLPLLCLAPLALRRGAPLARALVLAGAVHFLALTAAGGDWMTMYRLWVPVLPSFALAAAELWRVASPWASWARAASAGAMSVHLALALGPTARGVGPAREALIEAARGSFGSTSVQQKLGPLTVATLDVGWVGAVGDFPVVDLAGVTDESIAMLPGGHTSKRIDDSLLRHRDVKVLVLLRARPPRAGYEREVEWRVSQLPTAAPFKKGDTLPLGNGSGQEYEVRYINPDARNENPMIPNELGPSE
jgi:hypothetical protein